MATLRYGYQSRRRRPRPRGWWLVLPLMLVVGAVGLNSRLPDGGGALLTAGARMAPASITKIATALVAAERTDLSEMVDVEVDGAALAVQTESTIMGLQPGMEMSMRDLLYGLLLPSGNDAAIAIAEHVAGSVPAFVELMNEKADELGLRNTHFANPHGLDD